jgi:hypothetical protein
MIWAWILVSAPSGRRVAVWMNSTRAASRMTVGAFRSEPGPLLTVKQLAGVDTAA